jgi:AP-1 complex subunit sigma 1/2
LLVSRQGKTRLTKWFIQMTAKVKNQFVTLISLIITLNKEKTRAVRELTATVLSRPPKMCNFIEWQDKKVV